MKISRNTKAIVGGSLLATMLEVGCGLKGDDCANKGACAPDQTAGASGTATSFGGASNRGGASTAGSSSTQGGNAGGISNSNAGNSASGGGSAGQATSTPCNGSCSDATPLCDAASSQCVACLESDDCKDTSKPICDTASNTCVACLENADCNDAKASRCDASTNTCTPCTVDNDCAQIIGKGVCMLGAAGQTNQCVQCTGKKFDACGQSDGKALVCDSLSHTCSTTTTAQSAGLCQPCISDAQCKLGQYCVQQMYNNQPVGYFCFWKQGDPAGGAPADCKALENRPYVSTSSATSIDGDSGTFCMLDWSTCKAVNDFRNKPCASDSECGLGQGQDSKCVAVGTTQKLCTMACSSDVDCKVGYTCLPEPAPQMCSLDPATGTGGTSSTGTAGAGGR